MRDGQHSILAMRAVLDLPEVGDRHTFNLKRWKEVCADPQFAKIEGRVETDAHGYAILSPLPGLDHSERLGGVLAILHGKSDGRALVICPVSTSGGVRAVDVIWISDQRERRALKDDLLVIAPEICVEVLSATNTRGEMEEKRGLLFGAGAEEVWFCDKKGRMFFFMKNAPDVAVEQSVLYPDFPAVVE